jgi:hypothetical protein
MDNRNEKLLMDRLNSILFDEYEYEWVWFYFWKFSQQIGSIVCSST